MNRFGERGKVDPATLAAAAATAVVAAMTTDAWQQACSAVVRLWQRVHPSRAETIGEELAEVRQEVLVARKRGDTETETDLVGDWQRKLKRLLDADPEIADELGRLLDNVLAPSLDQPDQERVRSILMKARASGNARVYQAGRDIRINKR
jgi:hypothetical protein